MGGLLIGLINLGMSFVILHRSGQIKNTLGEVQGQLRSLAVDMASIRLNLGSTLTLLEAIQSSQRDLHLMLDHQHQTHFIGQWNMVQRLHLTLMLEAEGAKCQLF